MRVLILGSGGPAGVNTCRALADHEVIAADQFEEHLVWCKPHAETLHMPELTVEAVNAAHADLVIPQPDSVTMWLADHADQIEAKTFLPDRRTIALCQDKFEAGLAFRRAGLRTDRVELLPDGGIPTRFPFWLRARHGGGGKAAILARSAGEYFGWIQFWQARDFRMDFIAEAVLPGRDLAWSSIWYRGELVCSFLRERLEYIYPQMTPEGITGTPTIAQIVYDDRANMVAEATVRAVDATPHGIMSVDMREDAEGIPRPTEINAGRGFTTFGLWAMQYEPNLLEMVLDLSKGMYPYPDYEQERDCLQEGLKMYRHIDCGVHFEVPVCA